LPTFECGAPSQGATVGRAPASDFHTAALTYACVLEPGEKMTSDRVIDTIGPMAAATPHDWWELYQKDGDTSTKRHRDWIADRVPGLKHRNHCCLQLGLCRFPLRHQWHRSGGLARQPLNATSLRWRTFSPMLRLSTAAWISSGSRRA
jgi:hypothetical protein